MVTSTTLVGVALLASGSQCHAGSQYQQGEIFGGKDRFKLLHLINSINDSISAGLLKTYANLFAVVSGQITR